MKILVLESSGNIRGSSNMLADEFIRGAEENGHEVTVYNVIRKNIKPCLGCGHCGMSGACIRQDDYENELKPLIIGTDMIVFVMPVYYYNWPAPLKACVDRFYSFTGELTYMHKKTALLSVAWDDTDSVFAVTEFRGLRYRARQRMRHTVDDESEPVSEAGIRARQEHIDTNTGRR